GLLITRPENDGEEEQNYDHPDRLFLLRLEECEKQPAQKNHQRADHYPHLVFDHYLRAEEKESHRRADRGHKEYANQHLAPRLRRGLPGRVADMREAFAANNVLNQAESHPDARRAEAEMPIDLLAEEAGHERRGEGADVDSYVKDREARVAPLVLRAVEFADNRAHVRLKQPRPKDD